MTFDERVRNVVAPEIARLEALMLDSGDNAAPAINPDDIRSIRNTVSSIKTEVRRIEGFLNPNHPRDEDQTPGEKAKEVTKEYFKKIVDKVLKTVNPLDDRDNDGVPNAIDDVSSLGQKAVEAVSQAIVISKFIQDKMDEYWNNQYNSTLRQLAANGSDKAKQILNGEESTHEDVNVVKEITTAINETVNNLDDIISDIYDKVGEALGGLSNILSTLGTPESNSVSEDILHLKTTILNRISEGEGSILSALAACCGTTQSKLDELLDDSEIIKNSVKDINSLMVQNDKLARQNNDIIRRLARQDPELEDFEVVIDLYQPKPCQPRIKRNYDAAAALAPGFSPVEFMNYCLDPQRKDAIVKNLYWSASPSDDDILKVRQGDVEVTPFEPYYRVSSTSGQCADHTVTYSSFAMLTLLKQSFPNWDLWVEQPDPTQIWIKNGSITLEQWYRMQQLMIGIGDIEGEHTKNYAVAGKCVQVIIRHDDIYDCTGQQLISKGKLYAEMYVNNSIPYQGLWDDNDWHKITRRVNNAWSQYSWEHQCLPFPGQTINPNSPFEVGIGFTTGFGITPVIKIGKSIFPEPKVGSDTNVVTDLLPNPQYLPATVGDSELEWVDAKIFSSDNGITLKDALGRYSWSVGQELNREDLMHIIGSSHGSGYTHGIIKEYKPIDRYHGVIKVQVWK